MKRVFFGSLLLACAVLGLAGTTQATSSKEFVPLFNGVDLAGWYGLGHTDPYELEAMSDHERATRIIRQTVESRKHWWVADGELVNDGTGPYLTTDKPYGDIELKLEYRTVAGADSGIYLRSTPQVQIWDWTEAGGKWHLGADKGSGGLWNNQEGAPGRLPALRADKPFGQWNSLRILQIGELTTIYLNDHLVVDHARMENFWDREKPLRRRGHIQLQTHGGEIRWRNILLREIGAEEANAYLARHGSESFQSIFDGTLDGWAGPVDNYVVADGSLTCRPGKGGTIYYDRELTDFQVRLEFQLPAGGNNGLAIRYPGSGDTAYLGMAELQVLDNGAEKYAKLDPRQFHGSAYGMVAAHRGYLRPVGEWNFQEVTVKGSTIQVVLNGTRILDADLKDVTDFAGGRAHPGKDRKSGYFGLAGHNDPVRYRALQLRTLAD